MEYVDAASAFTVNLPVCVPTDDPDPATDPTVTTTDCTNRVENTYKDMVGACGYVADPATNCSCQVAESGFHDKNENGVEDSGEGYFGFTREICDTDCVEADLNLPADPADPARCDNFDPQAFAGCVAADLATCAQNGTDSASCDTSDCLASVAATNVAGDAPVCIAHASSAPQPLAFQLFGRRSTCPVAGRSHIQVGDDNREPEKQPLTGGTVEILGGPCPGASCAVGITTQLAMNDITFSVKFASDPTFSDLVQGGNSSLTAATLDPFGNGEIPTGAALAVARGRRDTNRQAFFGSNASPLGIGVDWANFLCALDGNLVSSVDAEDPQGLCAGDNATACRHDSPDCDDAGGPCQLPPTDSEPFTVNVSLEGPLVNQPPTAAAGQDQTVECTSPAGASFTLDGTGSSDPDGAGDLRIFSWRSASRTGAEVGFDPKITAQLGVGVSRKFVLRVIDSYGQADEDATDVEVQDTTPPVLSCNAPPTMSPPQTAVSFVATATDVCTAGTITPQLTSYQCFKFSSAGKRIDTTNSCKVTLDGAQITIGSSIGVGDHIAWNGSAADATGNVGLVHCEGEVVSQGTTK